jgi:hypothetical protein
MNLLICGDSFAADWTVKYSGQGWPNMLSQYFTVTNLAQAGCSEYKILKQLESVDLNQFDKIIISHTSPYRVYVERHPVHYTDPLHKQCDLIYSDIKAHSINDRSLLPIVEYFEKYFDLEHAKYMHTLICKNIQELLPADNKVLHISNSDWKELYQFPNMVNFYHLFKTNPGTMNHFDDAGNQFVYKQILNYFMVPGHGFEPRTFAV